MLWLLMAGFLASSIQAQVVPPMPPSPPVRPQASNVKGLIEKAISADNKVHIQIPCISEAKVSITGWNRDEIRVFIRKGTDISLGVQEKDASSGKPVWVLITRAENDGSPRPVSDCISASGIDIEVPVGATVSMKSREIDAVIDTIHKLDVRNLGGSLALRNIKNGITASAFDGSISVENAGGAVSLDTSSGNILAVETGPGNIGDIFKARSSSGAITLQKLGHRQVEVSSVSGRLMFDGKLLPGGLYGFKTTSGSISLSFPANSSSRISAAVGFGSFNPSFPMNVVQETESSGGKKLLVVMGKGEASVNITTSTGSVRITDKR